MQQEHINLVDLIGEVSDLPTEITLPSGEEIIEIRLSVAPTGSVKSSLDITVREKSLMRRARSLKVGNTIAVQGELHRRFWRSGGSVSTRLDIEADSLEKVG